MRSIIAWQVLLILFGLAQNVPAREPDAMINLWPGLAPGESESLTGEELPSCAAGTDAVAEASERVRDGLPEVITPVRASGTKRRIVL